MMLASNGTLSVSSIIMLVFIVILCVIGGIASSNMKRRK
jgi:hypothetical protein